MTSISNNDPTRLLADLDFVRSLARQLCRDEHTAEDVAQETLAAAITKPPAKEGNRRGWLATVTRNFARKHHRKERRLKDREAQVTSQPTAPSTDEVVEREQLRSAVVQAVLALPEPYRKIVLLRHYNGLEIVACAEALGIPQSTARTHLSRAIERLRQQLDREHGGDRNQWMAALMPFAVPTVGSATAGSADATTTALTANKKVIAWIAAASLTIGMIMWSQSHSDAPAPVPNNKEQTSTANVGQASTAEDQPAPSRDKSTPIDRIAAVPTSSAAWIATGLVTDDDNKPVRDARLRLWANIGDNFEKDLKIPIGDTRSGSDGRFSISIAALNAQTPIARSQMYIVCSADAVGYQPDFTETSLGNILAGRPNGILKAELRQQVLVKGRVTTSDGKPIHEAVVFMVMNNDSEFVTTQRDGSFAMEPPDPDDYGTYLLIARHKEHGRSQHVILRSNQRSETRIADLILNRPGQRITGRVLYPDGQPVADLDIGVEFMDDVEDSRRTLHGFEVLNYDELFHTGLHRTDELVTDEHGRFTYCDARPGKYQIDVDGDFRRTVEVGVAQAITHIDIEYDIANHSAQIAVRLEDALGKQLPDAVYGFHRWHGDEATSAHARFEREGATPELLLSAPKHESMFEGDHEFLDAEPDSFTIIESCYHDAGPIYGGCRLGPNQHRGSVVIVLTPRTKTGSLQIDVRDNNGDKLTPTWVRMCRIPTRSGIPIYLPGKELTLLPPSNIAGPWHLVTNNGRLYDLPAGPLTVEVLAGAETNGARLRRSAYPVQRYEVTVPHNGTAHISSRAQLGVPITVEMRQPQASPGERVTDPQPQIGLTSARGGRTMWLNLQPVDGSNKPVFKNGRCMLRSRSSFLPGTYKLRFHPSLHLLHLMPGKGGRDDKWRVVDTKWRKVERTIELSASAPAVVLQIEKQ